MNYTMTQFERLQESLLDGFARQRKMGMEIMGPFEEMYLITMRDKLGGAEIKKFVAGDVNHFMFIRACIKEDCGGKYKRKGPFVVKGDSLYMSEAIYLNYCKINDHVPRKFTVEEVA